MRIRKRRLKENVRRREYNNFSRKFSDQQIIHKREVSKSEQEKNIRFVIFQINISNITKTRTFHQSLEKIFIKVQIEALPVRPIKLMHTNFTDFRKKPQLIDYIESPCYIICISREIKYLR